MSNPTPAPLPVLLSASVPDEVIGTPEAQRLYDYVAAIVAALFDAGLSLVFGGHPTITPLVHQAVRARGEPRPSIDLFQLERFRGEAPPEALDGTVFERLHWVGDPALPIAADLANLREPMVALARAAIFIGGKTTGFQGGKPGIRDEFERFRTHHPTGPVYLVGGAGGETARIVTDANGQDWECNGLQGEARAVLHDSHAEHIVAAVIARDLERYRRQP
ncbi:hypothetical protein [uncultured Thiodictyon sp.]|uniref:SLOG domain-containing protein n=1 Tax=uncultured Thiodictyon sp. TaxID=1846217 RepID=UPI0025DB8FA7|nr:hypothetical protein [uncultured Thiodictyon sp.]